MKTIKIKSVFDAITRRMGLDPATANFSPAQRANIAELVNERIIKVWEMALWPDVLQVEQRYYRAHWNSELLYIEDDEVWFEGEYWKSLQDDNTGNEPQNGSLYWRTIREDDSFIRYIDFRQDGETEIDAIDVEDGLFGSDPRIYRDKNRVRDVVLLDGRIVVRTEVAPKRPWLRFRTVCPEFSFTDWSAERNYGIGDLVYLDAYGESYKALRPSSDQNPYSAITYWMPVQFPRVFKTYVIHAVASDFQTEDEGRYKEEAKANNELERLQEVMIDQQGLVRRACYRRS